MTSRMQNALRLAKPPANPVGLDRFCELANFELTNCLDWLEAPFPLSYRKKELRSLEQDEYFAPKVYLKSREWFRIEPDDTVNSFSFWYADGSRTGLSSFAYSQSINLVVFVNTERVFPEDNIHVETLINQTLQVLKAGAFYDSIPDTNELEVFEGLEDAWEDFDITTVNGQQFIKENYATFRIRFDVVYNLTDCLPCLESPLPPPPIEQYQLNLSEISADYVRILNQGLGVVQLNGNYQAEVEADISNNPANAIITIFGKLFAASGAGAMDRFTLFYASNRIFFRADNLDIIFPFVLADNPGFNKFGFVIEPSTSGFMAVRLFLNNMEQVTGTFRYPTNDLGLDAVFINSFVDVSNSSGLPGTQENMILKSFEINGNKWGVNEGSGFDLESNTGLEAEGFTSNVDGIIYWNNNVWEQV